MSKGPQNNLCCYFFDAVSMININRSVVIISICPTKNISKSIKFISAFCMYQIMHSNDSLYNDGIKVQHGLVSENLFHIFLLTGNRGK